jgi:hypothetical protein
MGDDTFSSSIVLCRSIFNRFMNEYGNMVIYTVYVYMYSVRIYSKHTSSGGAAWKIYSSSFKESYMSLHRFVANPLIDIFVEKRYV